MSKYYDEALIPAELRRAFDVYDQDSCLATAARQF